MSNRSAAKPIPVTDTKCRWVFDSSWSKTVGRRLNWVRAGDDGEKRCVAAENATVFLSVHLSNKINILHDKM